VFGPGLGPRPVEEMGEEGGKVEVRTYCPRSSPVKGLLWAKLELSLFAKWCGIRLVPSLNKEMVQQGGS
jgi:hypothetical protein